MLETMREVVGVVVKREQPFLSDVSVVVSRCAAEFDAFGQGRAYVVPNRRQRDDFCCLLYTSDAADERSSVDLGGRRIIKKKKKRENSIHKDIHKQ